MTATAIQAITLTVLALGVAEIARPQDLTTLMLGPTSVTGGQSSTGQVSLSGPVPTGGILVRLSSSNPSVVTVPLLVTVPRGATTASFPVTTVPVASSSFSIITADVGGNARSGRLDVAPPVLSSITLAPASIRGGSDVTGEVSLTGRAPAGGFAVQLSSNNPAVARPSSAMVTVPAGDTTRGFTVTTFPVGQSTTVTIAAFAEGVSKTALLNVQALLSSVSLASASVRGGVGTGGVVRLFLPAPAGGLTVQLSSSNTAVATVPASVTIPAGATARNFEALAIPVAQPTPVTITATVDGISKTAQLTVEPPVLRTLTLGPDSILGGTSATGEVGLTGPAPASGFAVTLSSSDPAVAAVPARFTVPGGATTAQFTYTTGKVAKATTVTITAAAAGATRSAQLTVDRS